MYRWNLMVLLSSLSSRDCARKFRQVLPQWSNRPITIFHPRDGKSPLARLPLAPWLLARHLVQAYSDTHFRHYTIGAWTDAGRVDLAFCVRNGDFYCITEVEIGHGRILNHAHPSCRIDDIEGGQMGVRW